MSKHPPKIEYEELPEEKALGAQKPDKTKEKLKLCEREKREYLEGWQRAKADLVNFRQRQERQMAEWRKMTNENLILELLPMFDTLDAAVKNSQGCENANYALLKKQLEEILKKQGLEKIQTENILFNPLEHEAVEHEETADPKIGDGQILEEISSGYKLNGRIIKTAKVKVAKKQ